MIPYKTGMGTGQGRGDDPVFFLDSQEGRERQIIISI